MREILHLFAFAQAMNLAEEPVVDGTDSLGLKTNIADAVTLILQIGRAHV